MSTYRTDGYGYCHTVLCWFVCQFVVVVGCHGSDIGCVRSGWDESVVGDIMRLLIGKGADVNLTTTITVSGKK
jgi:hypothetical protein